MWSEDAITVEVSDVDGDTLLVIITTPAGRIEMLGNLTIRGAVLVVRATHVQGLSPGGLGRAGLNAIARKLMREAGVDGLVVEGSTRTTGRTKGRIQRLFRYPNPSPPPDDR